MRGLKSLPRFFASYKMNSFCVCVDSSVGSDGQVAPRTGFFHDFKPKEVLIKVWNQELEGILLVIVCDMT